MFIENEEKEYENKVNKNKIKTEIEGKINITTSRVENGSEKLCVLYDKVIDIS